MLLYVLAGPAAAKPGPTSKYTPEILARVRELSLANPHIPIDYLAPVLQRDRTLQHIRWTSSSVAGLYRSQPGILPRALSGQGA